MSYDLIPRNKKVKGLSFGAFTWPILLQDTGICHVIGYGQGLRPASYVYQVGNGNIGSPCSNDGYKVTASEARMMATVARGFVKVHTFNRKEWDELRNKEMYNIPWHTNRIKLVDNFADFAENSGGFKIT